MKNEIVVNPIVEIELNEILMIVDVFISNKKLNVILSIVNILNKVDNLDIHILNFYGLVGVRDFQERYNEKFKYYTQLFGLSLWNGEIKYGEIY